jgi:hypothetical protein
MSFPPTLLHIAASIRQLLVSSKKWPATSTSPLHNSCQCHISSGSLSWAPGLWCWSVVGLRQCALFLNAGWSPKCCLCLSVPRSNLTKSPRSPDAPRHSYYPASLLGCVQVCSCQRLRLSALQHCVLPLGRGLSSTTLMRTSCTRAGIMWQ